MCSAAFLCKISVWLRMDALLRIPTCFAVLRQGEGNQMNMQNRALIITYKIKKKKKGYCGDLKLNLPHLSHVFH